VAFVVKLYYCYTVVKRRVYPFCGEYVEGSPTTYCHCHFDTVTYAHTHLNHLAQQTYFVCVQSTCYSTRVSVPKILKSKSFIAKVISPVMVLWDKLVKIRKSMSFVDILSITYLPVFNSFSVTCSHIFPPTTLLLIIC
jgi:hypothetical protein